MYTCASCTIHACKDPEHKDMPKNCPMRQEALVEEAKAEYQKPEVQKFFVTSSEIEHDGYCQWPRLKETMVFCKRDIKRSDWASASVLQRKPGSWRIFSGTRALRWYLPSVSLGEWTRQRPGSPMKRS